jgi:hypothetical protein
VAWRPLIFAGLLLILSLVGCRGDGSPRESASASTASLSTTSGATNVPTGDLAPAKLQGTWKLVSLSGKEIKVPLYVAISDRKYALRSTDVNGDFVVNGNQIDFFNESLCTRGTSGSDPRVGRYKWTLKGRKLHFRLLGKEPCGDRTGFFKNATYERIGSIS